MSRTAVESRATDELVSRIMEIENASFSVPWIADDFTAISPPHFLATARSIDGSLDGYGCFAVVEDDAEITNLAVAPEKRRLGIGSELLLFMISEAKARGARKCFLEVRESNSAARALYAAHGFRTVGVRRSYYRLPREDALVMVLEL